MGIERSLKRAVYIMFKARQPGDLLMDAPETDSWRELCTYACDRDYCRTRVRAMKQPRVTAVSLGSHYENEMTVPFTISTWALNCRFRLKLNSEWVWGMCVYDNFFDTPLPTRTSTQMSLRSYVNNADSVLEVVCRKNCRTHTFLRLILNLILSG